MACSHESCTCQIIGCGIDHPKGWKPKVTARINGVVMGGDDAADCMAHYMLHLGYPTDQPEHTRKIAESVANRHLT